MPRLYELSAAYESVRRMAEEDPNSDWTAALDGLQGEAQDKLVNIAKLVREWQSNAEVYAAEIERLTKRMEAERNRASRLVEYARQHMERLGLERVKGDVVSLRLQASPPTVRVADLAAVPPDFLRATISAPGTEVPEALRDRARFEVDKKAVLEAWKLGKPVPGTAVEQSRHLRIE